MDMRAGRRRPIRLRAQGGSRARYRGCLLGGAAGDALGAAVEFETLEAIRRRYGEPGIRDYAAFYGQAGTITDDTQMTLFTAEGLLRGRVRGADAGVCPYPAMLAAAYQRWRHTQGEPESSGVRVPLDGWLLGHRALRARCAPDATSLRALAGTGTDSGDAADPGRSCGAVMRVAPIGLFVASFAGRGEPEAAARAFRLGVASAAITHAHPSAQLSAGAMAMIVARLVQRTPLERALAEVRDELAHHAVHRETLEAIDLAVLLAHEDPVGVDTLMRLGDGFEAPGALAIALYCALVATSLEDGVILAVNHSGNSATTGALAGQLLGAMYGVAAIAERWIAGLELGELVRELADDLASVARWPLDDAGVASCAYRRKYPGR